MTIQEKINKRLESNRLLVKKLSELVEKYPEQRFGQILYNYGFLDIDSNYNIKDPFYEESVDTLKRIKL